MMHSLDSQSSFTDSFKKMYTPVLSTDAAMFGLVEDKESNINMDSGEVMEHAVADTVAAMSEGKL